MVPSLTRFKFLTWSLFRGFWRPTRWRWRRADAFRDDYLFYFRNFYWFASLGVFLVDNHYIFEFVIFK